MANRFVRKLTISSKSTANTYSVGTNLFTNTNGVTLGDVYFVNAATGSSYGTVVDSSTIASVTDFSVVFARGNGLLDESSVVINKNSIVKSTKETYQAGQDEIQYFGYDGATAGLDITLTKGTNVNAANVYGFLISNITDITYQDLYKPYAIYRSTEFFAASTPTAAEKVLYFSNIIGDINGTVNDINSKLFRSGSENVSKYIDAMLLTTGTYTAIAGAVTAAYNSNIITVTAHGQTVGTPATPTFLRVGGAAASTTTTYGVYQVSRFIDANTVELLTPYKGATISAVANGSALWTGGGSPVFGIKLSVKPNVVTYDDLSGVTTVQFDASFALRGDNESSLDLGYVAPKTVVPARWSSGAENSVRELEYDQYPQKGMMNKTEFPVLRLPSYVTAGTNYDIYTIVYYKSSETGIQTLDRKPRHEMICVPTASTLSTYVTGVVSALPNYTAI